MARTRRDLDNWSWRLADSNGQCQAEKHGPKHWTPVTSFPSVIQSELLAKGVIPDPYIGENERQIQWVGACDWDFRATFATPTDGSDNVDLVFEGLDTFATVRVNGNVVLESNNMFVPARVNVKRLLKAQEEQNEVEILFESALKVGTRLEEKYGERKSVMRDKRRNHARKAQYSWGWDWGPIIVTSGPWKPIYLESYASRIDDVYIRTKLGHGQSSAEVTINIEASHSIRHTCTFIEITDGTGTTIAHTSVNLDDAGKSQIIFKVKDPKLWWPTGQGKPHIYTAYVRLLDSDSNLLDETRTRFGIRSIELIQRPLNSAPGKTFMFRVNGRDIFIQGGNWIPADNFLPSITRQRYFDWVRTAKHAHVNMIRVWGGGIYESEDFFDACDEEGILVWHDYAFACGDYPTHDEFLKDVEKEAKAQTKRLRNRASLALWAGGNEDFLLADFMGPKYDHSDTKGPFLDKPFPQREIYLSILPRVVDSLNPDVPYWPSSPWGGAWANDTTVGDIHQWSVWHLEQKPYQEYKNLAGRFVSEFGMHGFPVNRTVDYFTRGAQEKDLHPQSKLIDCHNKGQGAHTRIARYLAENFRFDMTSLRNFIYSSQLMQSEAYGYALRDWKRLFNGPGEELCAGLIIWQLNDVYPSTSWSFIDYFIRPKPAYYIIKRAFAPISVGIERTPNTRWIDEDKPRDSYIPTFDIFAHNTTPNDRAARLELRAYDFYNNKWTDLKSHAKKQVTLLAGRNTEILKLDKHPSWIEESLVILEASIIDLESGEILARHVDWPEPYRYLTWPNDTKITIRVNAVTEFEENPGASIAWDSFVTVSSNQPLKGVWLEPIYDGTEKDDDPEPLWEDNMFDLMPDQEISVKVSGLKKRSVSARFLYDWELPCAQIAPSKNLRGNL